jgi:low temperature requirement protein LtrA
MGDRAASDVAELNKAEEPPVLSASSSHDRGKRASVRLKGAVNEVQGRLSVGHGRPSPHLRIRRGTTDKRRSSLSYQLGKKKSFFRIPKIMVSLAVNEGDEPSTPRDESARPHNWFEHFYDLVYVAMCLIMGNVLGADVTIASSAFCFLVVMTFSAKWYSVTCYINRFHSEDLKHQTFFLVQTACVIIMSQCGNLIGRRGGWTGTVWFSVMLAVSRIALVVAYSYIGEVFKEEGLAPLRSMYVIVSLLSLFCLSFSLCLPSANTTVLLHRYNKQHAVAAVLYLVSAVGFSMEDAEWVGIAGWILQLVLDHQASYWLGPEGPAACLRHAPIPQFDIEHMSNRLGEFTMLILGESVISLCFAYDAKAAVSLSITGLGVSTMVVFFCGCSISTSCLTRSATTPSSTASRRAGPSTSRTGRWPASCF